MAIVTVEKNRYVTDSLYQWDKDQTLQIYGLSLPSIPEIHFSNTTMGGAIVRQATMDESGVVSVNVPNSLLQKPYKITVYVCVYEGRTFKTLYSMVIPVEARSKPADYTLENTNDEIYSFNALENRTNNALALAEKANNNIGGAILTANNAKSTANNAANKANEAYTIAEDAFKKVSQILEEEDEDNDESTAEPHANSHASNGEDPITPAMIGAVSETGGTMTGSLVAKNDTNYTTYQVRNIVLIAEGDPIPSKGSDGTGDIVLVYKP